METTLSTGILRTFSAAPNLVSAIEGRSPLFAQLGPDLHAVGLICEERGLDASGERSFGRDHHRVRVAG
jgi:hypothetical protein